MEGFESINNALEYIEKNLENKIDYARAAQTACCSEYHLSRMFSSIAGVSLSEYIRRRRLTRAAFEIQNSDIRILDVAVQYGYESADSFARAFHKMHGIKPSEARKKGVQLIAYPRLSFHITIDGEAGIVYRIETLDADINIIGKAETVKTSRAPEDIPLLWKKAGEEGFLQTLTELSGGKVKKRLGGLLGVYEKGAADPEGTFDYLIGIRSEKPEPEGMTSLKIRSGAWIVFTELQEARKRLFSEWIPTLGYELAEKPFIECVYGPGHIPEMELWVPIVTKEKSVYS